MCIVCNSVHLGGACVVMIVCPKRRSRRCSSCCCVLCCCRVSRLPCAISTYCAILRILDIPFCTVCAVCAILYDTFYLLSRGQMGKREERGVGISCRLWRAVSAGCLHVLSIAPIKISIGGQTIMSAWPHIVSSSSPSYSTLSLAEKISRGENNRSQALPGLLVTPSTISSLITWLWAKDRQA